MRKFKNVTLTVNVDKKRSYAVFKRSEIFFASIDDQFSDTVLQYCPRIFSDDDIQFKRNVSFSLCENTARFIKLRLYFGGRWLLITEISFDSGILACQFLLEIIYAIHCTLLGFVTFCLKLQQYNNNEIF